LAAYDVLVGRYEAVVYSHCRRLLGQREDGEDVAQEVFVRAWEALGQCRRPDRPLPWLLSIAHHQAMNFLRRRRRHPKPEEVAMMGGWDGETGNDWDGAAQAGEVDPGQITVEELERAVEELSSEDGALFELRYRGELSIREVAEVLQRRENAVKVGLHRLRGRIQQAVIRRRGGQS
jgi:RNA polymerase sigma-70 factor (ECF subfamily)